MDEYEFLLFDRLEIIRTINNQYDLEKNAYLSFSGGKDSTILHYLLDLALPNNQIPRVFSNTGIEYSSIVQFVKSLAAKDDRFILLEPSNPIKKILDTFGYPIKSKQHSQNLAAYQKIKQKNLSNIDEIPKTLIRYLGIKETNTLIRCPNKLRYQFTPEFKLKCSDKCCLKLKKEPLQKWQKLNHKNIILTGMRREEGGQRKSIKGCLITNEKKKEIKFHPILVVKEDFIDWFIKQYDINLCKLYYSPFNFNRTGCKGCPFSLDLQEQLDIMEQYLPNEKKQCEIIWQPVYEEYRKIGYRLQKHGSYKQIKLF